MSRPGRNGRSRGRRPTLSAGLTLLIAMAAGLGPARPSKPRPEPANSPVRLARPASPPPGRRSTPASPSSVGRRRPAAAARRPARPTSRSSGSRGPEGMTVEVLGPAPTPVPPGRRRRHPHRRPEARRRLSAADRQHPRAPGRRAVPRHRGRGTPASPRGDRPRQVSRSG